MAKVPNDVETLPKISAGWVWCTNVTDDRQTDDRGQTDWRATAYSERELAFTFPKTVLIVEIDLITLFVNHVKSLICQPSQKYQRMQA